MMATTSTPKPLHVQHSEAVTNGTPCTCGCGWRNAPVTENRYHAPLAEKTADELLLAIKKHALDAQGCRFQLHRDGWTDAHIATATGLTEQQVREAGA